MQELNLAEVQEVSGGNPFLTVIIFLVRACP
jgi:hypothetical protein